MWLRSTEFDEDEHPYYTVHNSHSAYTKTPKSESPVPVKKKSQNVPECPTGSYFPNNVPSATHPIRPALNFTITRKMQQNATPCNKFLDFLGVIVKFTSSHS